MGYLCSICKNFWTKEEDAIKCESGHQFMKFEPLHVIGDNDFPIAIRAVKWTDGKEQQECFYVQDDQGIQDVKEEEVIGGEEEGAEPEVEEV
jgi:hypothetical protein